MAKGDVEAINIGVADEKINEKQFYYINLQRFVGFVWRAQLSCSDEIIAEGNMQSFGGVRRLSDDRNECYD